jgi:multiple sugar transport system substrate-binding protein/raffinose/stachyose/melibiose transport system substrate-binding protein
MILEVEGMLMLYPNKHRVARGVQVALAVGAASAMALVSGCSAPGSTNGSAPAAVATAANTDAASLKASLVLYDGAGLKTVDDALIAAFTKKYPNITITTRFDPDNVQATNAPRVLASDNPPDIARINALSDIVKANLLTPLDPWAKAYNWSGSIPSGQLAQYTVDSSGVRGTGTQYTVASGFTVTGFYYNKDVLAKLGIAEAPKTMDDLNADLAKAKAAGVTPIMAGNKSGQVATTLQFMLNNSMGADAINGWIFHKPGASINTAEGVAGAQTIADWAAKGYYPEDTNGTDATAALGRFVKGEALFFASGNWDAKSLQSQLGDKVGFTLPPQNSAGKTLAMSDPLSNFGIPAKSKNQDAAAAFLNFLLSPEARQISVDNGFAPSGKGDLPSVEAGSLNESVQKAFASLVEADGQVQYIQNATNGTSATVNAQVQLLVAGKATAADVMAKLQAAYEEELGK